MSREDGRSDAIKCSKETNKYGLAAVLIAFLDFIILTLILLTYIFMSQESFTHDSEFSYCLPCSEVRGHPDDGLPAGIVVYSNNNNDKCCAENTSNLSVLIREFTTTWQDKKHHEENPSFSKCKEKNYEDKPLIKLILNEHQGLSNPMQVDWEVAFSRTNKLSYSDGYVTVKHSGLYFIYTQISFQFQQNVTKHPEFPRHHIIGIKQVGSTEETYRPITRGSSSHCRYAGQSEGTAHNSTSFIGTLYRLKKDDQVSVRVHDRLQLIHNKHMSAFGMHML